MNNIIKAIENAGIRTFFITNCGCLWINIERCISFYSNLFLFEVSSLSFDASKRHSAANVNFEISNDFLPVYSVILCNIILLFVKGNVLNIKLILWLSVG